MIRAIQFVALCAALAAMPAVAQQAYVPPDKDLWDAMVRAVDDLPMSAAAHRQAQDIFANVQREAQMRAARPKPMEMKPVDGPK